MQFKLNIAILTTPIISLQGFGQVDIINRTATVKPDSAVIFKGLREPNIIEVTGMINSNLLQLKATRLGIKKAKDPFLFNATAQSLGLDTIYLLSKGKVVFKKQFQIVNPLPIRAMVGSIKDSTATIQQIILYPLLRVVIPDCKCFPGHVTGRFTIKFFSTHIEEWEKESEVLGGNFTNLIKTIKKLQPGDRIIFYNISTIDVDSLSVKLPDLSITIK